MRHPIFPLLATTTTMPPSPPFPTKPRKPSSSSSSSAAVNHHHHSLSATATAAATLDLIILILVLFSGTFLLTSYFSYIFNSLSPLLPPLLHHHFPLPYLLGFLLFFFFTVVTIFFFTGGGGDGGFFRLRSRRCGNPKCKGLKKAMEFDLQLQTEECLKSNPNEIDRLPWKGGTENNPVYECLRVELRKMAPPNGRAVLLFRAKCGCPVAKLIGWGPKKRRKHKKSLATGTANRDHR